MLSSYVLYHLQDIWVKLKIPYIYNKISSKGFGATNVIGPIPSPISSLSPIPIQKNPIPRRWLKEPLLGRPHVIQFQDSEAWSFLNQTFNMENPRGHFAVIFFVEYPKMLDIFLWKWYLFENCWDHMVVVPQLFSFRCEVFWERHTTKIWKTGPRNPLSPSATPAPTLRIHMIPMVGGCLRFPWLKDVELLLLVTTVPRYFGVLSPWLLIVEIQNIKCARNGRPNNHRGYTPKEMMIWNIYLHLA